jgi:hypothetical protein
MRSRLESQATSHGDAVHERIALSRNTPLTGWALAGWGGQANAYLLATCYYRSEQTFRVLHVLKGV